MLASGICIPVTVCHPPCGCLFIALDHNFPLKRAVVFVPKCTGDSPISNRESAFQNLNILIIAAKN